ncbi:hypothetical protein GWI33_019368 [Rhynchophorus ferrugineus]|uniref:Uncharacterized protein n=1 Tax=Rhynchophorus ferrugineus TaxID=354439 RepID=A0A834M1E8_RHYFE|nr:hypothetical protein GWI33_019368 [Rhynchophorus ferrugineus]
MCCSTYHVISIKLSDTRERPLKGAQWCLSSELLILIKSSKSFVNLRKSLGEEGDCSSAEASASERSVAVIFLISSPFLPKAPKYSVK